MDNRIAILERQVNELMKEGEELKKRIGDLAGDLTYLQKKNDDLEKENKEIKKKMLF